jgi:hypothetical protein
VLPHEQAVLKHRESTVNNKQREVLDAEHGENLARTALEAF